MRKSVGSTLLLLTLLSISGCTKMLLPMSESELVHDGQSVHMIADTDFITAFSRLKSYTSKCLASIPMSSNLDREKSKATLIRYSDFGGFVSRIALTPTNDGKTKIHFTHIKTMVNAQKTLNSDAAKYKWVSENYQQGEPCSVVK